MFKKRKYVQVLFSNPSIEEEAGVMFVLIFFVEIIKKILLKELKVFVFCFFLELQNESGNPVFVNMHF